MADNDPIEPLFHDISKYCQTGKFKDFKWEYNSNENEIKYKDTFETSELCSYNSSYWEDNFIKQLLRPCDEFKQGTECNLSNQFETGPYKGTNPSDLCNSNTCELIDGVKLHQKYRNSDGEDYVLEQGDDIYNNNNSINDTILVKTDEADKLIEDNNDKLQKDKVDVSEYLIEYDKYLNNANDGDGEGINYTELINMKGCFEDIGTCGGDSASLLEYCTDNSTCYNNEDIDKFKSLLASKRLITTDKLKNNEYVFNLYLKIRKNTLDILKINDGDVYTDFKKFPLFGSEIEIYFGTNRGGDNLPESGLTDSNLNIIYPRHIQQIKKQYKNNKHFSGCIDDLIMMDEDDMKILKDISGKDFNDWVDYKKINKTVVKFFVKIEEIGPHSILNCMEKLNDTQFNKCSTELIEEYLQVLFIIFEYFHIKININNIKPENRIYFNAFVDNTVPYVRKLFKKTLDYTEYLSTQCKDSDKENIQEKLKSFHKIYDNLFINKNEGPRYALFENMGISSSFFDNIADTYFKKIVIIILLLFFFSQIIKLFQGGSSPSPPIEPK